MPGPEGISFITTVHQPMACNTISNQALSLISPSQHILQ